MRIERNIKEKRKRKRENYVDHFSLLTFTQHRTRRLRRCRVDRDHFAVDMKNFNSLNPSLLLLLLLFCDDGVVTVAALFSDLRDDDLVL